MNTQLVLTVRITKCEKPGFWYSDQINIEFKVTESDDKFYRVWSDPAFRRRLIKKCDCEIVATGPERVLL